MVLRNVVVVYDFASINGGQAKVAITSAVGLARSGLKVTFFAGKGPVDNSLSQAGVRVVCLDQHDILSDPSRMRAMTRGIWNIEAAARLQALLDEFDPSDTIVHCHGYAKVLSGAIGPVITGHAVPHVFTMHEYFLVCPNGGFFDYQRNEICTRTPLGAACLTTHCDSRKMLHKVWRVVRQIASRRVGHLPGSVKNLIYISETQYRAIKPYIPARIALFNVSNPVETTKQPATNVGKNDIFLFVGRLSPEKGAVLLAKAARKAGARLVFVGDGEERARIEQENPDALVTGWQTPAEVDSWLRKARCVVFPSLWYECQPLVPLEAYARGVPVIAGRWCAAADQIEHDKDGLVIGSIDETVLADAMSRMTPAYADKLGKAAYGKFWTDPATLERHVDDLRHIYSTILGRQDGCR